MNEYLYGPKKIAAAIRASEKQAAVRPPKKVAEDAGNLEVTHSIPKELYWNAVIGHGEDPNDMCYWRDMERYVPSIRVKSAATKIVFGPLSRFTGPVRLRNRFGVVKWRRVYT